MRRSYALRAIGVILCLLGALLMIEGRLFGVRTTGIATVVGIVGIGLISQSSQARRRMQP